MNRKLFDSLNEKQQRLYLGELAAEYGKGGITKVAAEYGASRERVSKGMREYNAGESYRKGEAVRRAGGGRKKKTEIYPNLEKRIVELVEANDGTYGTPTDERKWTALSQRKLSRMLACSQKAWNERIVIFANLSKNQLEICLKLTFQSLIV